MNDLKRFVDGAVNGVAVVFVGWWICVGLAMLLISVGAEEILIGLGTVVFGVLFFGWPFLLVWSLRRDIRDRRQRRAESMYLTGR